MRTLILAFLFLATVAEKPISIRVDKTVFYAGQDITITCVVPRHADNRKVEALLLPEFSSSEHQLNGDAQDAITHRFLFKRVPADVTSAACQLTDKYSKHAHAIQPLQVVTQ